MFKRVVGYRGFWKSVAVLGIIYTGVMFMIQWAFTGFDMDFKIINVNNVLVFILAGYIVGFSITYGKFWGKIKQQDHRK